MGAPIPHWSGLAEDTDPANLRDDRGPWDKVLFDGAALPGIAEVEVQAGRKIDSRGAPGRNGSRLVDKGAEAAKVTVKLRVWTVAQLQALSGQFPSLSYREERVRVRRELTTEQALDASFSARAAEAGSSTDYRRFFSGSGAGVPVLPTSITENRTRRSRAPVGVSHPACVLAGISFVYVERIRIGTPKNGELELTFECLEWTPPARRALGTAAPTPRAQGIGNIAVTRPFQAPPPSSGP